MSLSTTHQSKLQPKKKKIGYLFLFSTNKKIKNKYDLFYQLKKKIVTVIDRQV